MTNRGIRRSLAALILVGICFASSALGQTTDEQKRNLIMKALPGLQAASVQIRDGQGKVDADGSHKMSYFVFTADPTAPDSPTMLIPLATSRFDAYNYQTDEWWDQNKAEVTKARAEGRSPPRQDPGEVAAWLKANGLSTNPDVMILGQDQSIKKQPLRDYLLDYYLKRFGDDGYVTLYRGGEKPGELASWRQKQFPRGARYWTPDATYAWRYARKNTGFMKDLVEGNDPIFKFRIPKEVFKRWVYSGAVVLGAELTRKTHETFARTGRFQDPLAEGDYYLGDGYIGLELEIRGAQGARNEMPNYFVGAVSVEELAAERRALIERGFDRLSKQYKNESARIAATKDARLKRLDAEEKVLKALSTGASRADIEPLTQALPSTRAEIANVDSTQLSTFALSYVPKTPIAPACLELGAAKLGAYPR